MKKEEKEKERQKRQLDNDSSTYSDSTERHVLIYTSLQTVSLGKTPIESAIELDLNEKQVTKFYKEYWKLKELYKLYLIHDEIKDDIVYFAKLYRLSKAAGMSTEHAVNLLEIARNDLPALENRYEKLQRNVDYLESSTLDASITLEDLKSRIQDANL